MSAVDLRSLAVTVSLSTQGAINTLATRVNEPRGATRDCAGGGGGANKFRVNEPPLFSKPTRTSKREGCKIPSSSSCNSYDACAGGEGRAGRQCGQVRMQLIQPNNQADDGHAWQHTARAPAHRRRNIKLYQNRDSAGRGKSRTRRSGDETPLQRNRCPKQGAFRGGGPVAARLSPRMRRETALHSECAAKRRHPAQ